LKNDKVLVAEVEEVVADIGAPDCRLIKPYVLSESGEMTSWMSDFTNQSEMMMRSDDVLTFIEPNGKIIDKYLELTT
tara:strand:+ start:287 stop:517 length:231 start_codon:yes stop_codon:yes gene_type:complete